MKWSGEVWECSEEGHMEWARGPAADCDSGFLRSPAFRDLLPERDEYSKEAE